MKTFLALIILQFGLFAPSGEPVPGVKVYVTDAASSELIAFTKIGYSGEFHFSNLDPGNYLLAIEVPEHSIRIIDKKEKQKYESDITVSFNTDKNTFNWHRSDGYLEVGIDKISKVAESFLPKFEVEKSTAVQSGPGTQNSGGPGGFLGKMIKSNNTSSAEGKITILQFTVIDQFGLIEGYINSVAQRTHHKMTIGTGDIKLEDQGVVNVLKREE